MYITMVSVNVYKFLQYNYLLKSGTPAFVDIPAPHIMIIFLNLPFSSSFATDSSVSGDSLK